MSAGERTGWRDAEISQRHRRWGFTMTATDIDFLLVEYVIGAPVALVEYKRWTAPPVSLGHPTYTALANLADRDPAIPFLIARYWPETWAFLIRPVNGAAIDYFGRGEVGLSEHEYVTAMHHLRSVTLQEAVARNLNRERPPESLAS